MKLSDPIGQIELGEIACLILGLSFFLLAVHGILTRYFNHKKEMIDKEIELAYAKAQPVPSVAIEEEEDDDEDDGVVIGNPTSDEVVGPRYDEDGLLSEGLNVSDDGKKIKVEHHTAKCDTLIITTDDPNYKIRKTGKIISEDGSVIRIERGFFGTNGIDTNGQWFGTGKIDEVDASKVEQIIRLGSKIVIKCELEEVEK